jgi:hypothetical protein
MSLNNHKYTFIDRKSTSPSGDSKRAFGGCSGVVRTSAMLTLNFISLDVDTNRLRDRFFINSIMSCYSKSDV